ARRFLSYLFVQRAAVRPHRQVVHSCPVLFVRAVFPAQISAQGSLNADFGENAPVLRSSCNAIIEQEGSETERRGATPRILRANPSHPGLLSYLKKTPLEPIARSLRLLSTTAAFSEVRLYFPGATSAIRKI